MNALEVPQVKALLVNVIDPVIQVLWAVAIVYFLWGVFKYIRNSDDPSERQTGGKHIMWSVVGLFIMVSAWGIISVLKSTWGI